MSRIRLTGLILAAGMVCAFLRAPAFAQERQSATVAEKSALDENLEELMKTFPSKMSRQAVPTLQELQSNMYTGKPLVFKGSGNDGETADVQAPQAAGYADKTIGEMQGRLEQSEKDAVVRAAQTRFFSARLQEAVLKEKEERERWEKYQKNRMNYYQSDFPGKTFLIAMPPNNLVEVPAADHIPYMFARVEILGDGSVSVSETVQRVVSGRGELAHGLNRYFPYTFKDRAGEKFRTKITLLSATHNGEPITPKLMPSLFGYRVSLGDEPLLPGVHVYRWSYILAHQVSSFDDFKELSYSITGNHWFFPVTRAGAYVIFPQSTQVLGAGAKTGDSPLTDELYRVRKDANGDLSFTLRYPLAAAEEFTVFANFKENVPTFTPPESFMDVLTDDYATTVAAFLMFAIVLSYYVATWYDIKKNRLSSFQNMKPSQKDDFNAAVLRYALTKKADAKNFFILLLSMAGKGFLAMAEQKNGDFLLIKQTDSTSKLNPLEKKVAKGLFAKSETSFAVNQGNTLKLDRLFAALTKMIQKDYAAKYVTVYITYFLFGILMTAIALGFISGLSLYGATTAMTAAGLLLFAVGAYLVGVRMLDEIRLKSGWFVKSVLGLTEAYLIVPMCVLLWFFGVQTSYFAAFFLLATIACIIVSYTMLKSPSALGRSILDSLDAYRAYLSAKADSRLAGVQNVESKMRLLYDKHLPFAVALDLQTDWTEKFTAAQEGKSAFKPAWYKGDLAVDGTFVDKLFECFALRFPKKTYYFGNNRTSGGSRVITRPAPAKLPEKAGNKSGGAV